MVTPFLTIEVQIQRVELARVCEAIPFEDHE
jgi:hypothetical protein